MEKTINNKPVEYLNMDYVRTGTPEKGSRFATLNGREQRAIIEKAMTKVEAHKKAYQGSDIEGFEKLAFQKLCEYYAHADRKEIERMVERESELSKMTYQDDRNRSRAERINQNAQRIEKNGNNIYKIFNVQNIKDL